MHAGSTSTAKRQCLLPGCIVGVPARCSTVKMVNQLLADVHIVAAAEAMALGARAGLDTKMLYDIIRHCAGTSWYCIVSLQCTVYRLALQAVHYSG